MRDYSLRGLLSEAREGSEKDFDDSILQPQNNPTKKNVIRAFNLGLRQMLDQAIGTSYDDTPQRKIEERNPRQGEKRGWGLTDLLSDAMYGSG